MRTFGRQNKEIREETNPRELSCDTSLPFTTDLLPDGKIVVEIAHRTPYEVVQQGVRMAVTLGIYVVDLDERSSLMLPQRIGQLLAADADGSLYFLETRPYLRQADRPELTRVVLK